VKVNDWWNMINTRKSDNQLVWNGNLINPSLKDAITGKLKYSLKPIGTSGDIILSVMRAGYFVEHYLADDVPIVSWSSPLLDRGFKCDVDINIKINQQFISAELNASKLTVNVVF